MEDPDEELRVAHPLLDGVAEQRLDLRARVDVRGVVGELVDVDDQGQLLDESPVVVLQPPLPDVGAVELAGDVARQEHERDEDEPGGDEHADLVGIEPGADREHWADGDRDEHERRGEEHAAAEPPPDGGSGSTSSRAAAKLVGRESPFMRRISAAADGRLTVIQGRSEAWPLVRWSAMRGYRSARRGRWRRAFRLTALTLLVLALLAGGAFAAAVHWWSGATLAPDPVALARLELQPLAGTLVSARAYTQSGVEFPVTVSHGRLVPGTPVPTGLGVQVRIVVRRSGLLAHLLGRRRVEELTVQAPASAPASRYVTVARGAPVRIRFTMPVDRVTVGGRKIEAGGARTVSLGARAGAAGTIVLASAARPWEQLGRPVRVTWFRASRAPAVLVSPKPSTTVSPGTSLRLVFAEPVADVLGSAKPRITPDVAGRWSEPDTHTLVFHPAGFGFPFGKTVRARLGKTTSAGRTVELDRP